MKPLNCLNPNSGFETLALNNNISDMKHNQCISSNINLFLATTSTKAVHVVILYAIKLKS